MLPPEKRRGNQKKKNTDLKTIGGIEDKIKSLKETQSKAMGEQAIALQKRNQTLGEEVETDEKRGHYQRSRKAGYAITKDSGI